MSVVLLSSMFVSHLLFFYMSVYWMNLMFLSPI